jgi:hypothetical protein
VAKKSSLTTTSETETITFEPAGSIARAWMMDDASFVKVLIGPVGSGKTSAAVVEILRRAQMQAPGPDGIRRVRVACIRNTFSDLKSTTIKSWTQWCPASYGKLTMGGSPIVHHIKTADLDLEVLFLPLNDEQDVRKLLSLELSFAWIDEAREVPRSILDALTGRVGRYPSRMDGGCSWSAILLTSNPSDTESWLYKLDANPPTGFTVYRQPSGLSPEAENLPNLPPSYYQRISAGKDPEWLKVFVDGEFGFVLEGTPVYSNWRDSIHVARDPIPPVPSLGLTIGADWGLTPAAVICQQYADGRIVVLDEFIPGDSGIIRFASALTAHIRQHYPNHEIVAAVGDPSGTTRQADERSVFDLMNAHTPWRWKPARTNDVTLRIEAVTAALGRLVDGRPGFQLNPGCGVLRKGFAGGYHFRKIHTAGGPSFHEVPNKNEYSHPHDALQYAVLACGGAELILNRGERRERLRAAEGIDYDPMGDAADGAGRRDSASVVWGNGRPSHLEYRRPRNVHRCTDSGGD